MSGEQFLSEKLPQLVLLKLQSEVKHLLPIERKFGSMMYFAALPGDSCKVPAPGWQS